MDTLDAIATRRSIARTLGPALDRAEVEQLLAAAIMAPNHHVTEPWRFIVTDGADLQALGEAFARSATDAGTNAEAARRLPRLAPTVLVVVDRAGHDHHVSAMDEHYAVGAAMQNVLLAAHALGLGAILRTGPHVTSEHVRDDLGIKPDERIAGFIHLGRVAPDFPELKARRTPFAELTEWRTDDTR